MNTFTPYLPGEEHADPETLKPVLFWLHGGGGTATDATYDGASLTSRSDVVLVSINWRGGNFGTLSFNDGFVNGNYGIADIVAGLQWVQDHIRAFGGNPNAVTVFGQSAGGESVLDIAKSPKAKGLFSGVILQSAAVGPAVTQEEIANATGKKHITQDCRPQILHILISALYYSSCSGCCLWQCHWSRTT